jgi:hypothetical protein
MPYIVNKLRLCLRLGDTAKNPGELNYQISMLINDYCLEKRLSYQTINDVVGALEGAKLEFYRRVAGPYEDTKIATNGDVYDQNLFSGPDVGPPAI